MRPISSRWTLCLLLAATLCMVLLTSCLHHADTPVPPPVTPAPTFVGNAACMSCHQEEFHQQSHSRHAQTLHLASPQGLGNLAPPQGKIPGTDFVISLQDGQYAIASPSQSDEVAPLRYALGSGKTGMTYAFPVPGGKLVEVRLSYFPAQKQWYITPGQENLTPDVVGKVHPPADGQKCLLCHAVTIAPDSLKVETSFFGVGCESCHGPGSAHVAAMRKGDTNSIAMENLAQRPASRLNALCGNCHGTIGDSEAAKRMRNATNRFQAFGLMQSQCYQQSNDTLSCITCHNPHADASTNLKTYEAVCLNCHSTVTKPLTQPAVVGKPCPVNPKSQCIGCHMPSQQAIPNTSLPTFMADHFIRI